MREEVDYAVADYAICGVRFKGDRRDGGLHELDIRDRCFGGVQTSSIEHVGTHIDTHSEAT